MRAALGVMVMALIGLSAPAIAQCVGKYPNMVCFSDTGDVWSPLDYYIDSYARQRDPKIGKYPNGTAARPDSKPAAGSATSGETVVLKPSAQSGNAWVATPQTNGGATVLHGTASPGGAAATCGSGSTCP